MIDRTLEPEYMDSRDEAILYDQMDHREVNHRFVDDLLAGGEVGQRVIDLGTGTARIPILICERDPGVQVIAVDAATHMLDVAIRNIDIAGLRNRIQLVHADAKDLATYFDTGMCDCVISNTLLHHIPDPEVVVREAFRLVEPGGRVFLRDLMRPESAEMVERLTELHAGGEPEEAKQLLRQSLHAALSLDEIRTILRRCGQDPQAAVATSDRHWTVDLRVVSAEDAGAERADA